MVEIEFVNGDKETVETRDNKYSPWMYIDDIGCFWVPSIEGDFYYPKDFIQSLAEYPHF